MSKCKNKRKHIIRAVIVSLCAVLVLAAAFAVNIFAAEESTGDSITIGSDTYMITDAKTLVGADLALLQCRAKGQTDTVHIEGTLNGEKLEGFDAVYEKIYDMLLGLFDTKTDTSVIYYDISKSNVDSNNKYITTMCPTNGTSSSTVLWKITGEVELSAQKPISSVGRVIIIAENSATITMSKIVNDDGELTNIGSFSIAGTSSLVIQGRNSEKKITVTSDYSNRDGNDAIRISGGNLYLQYCTLTDFEFNSGSAIELPNSYNTARYVYMSDSSLSNISATEAPGIFCKAYSTTTSNVKNSALYLFNSNFSNCVTRSGSSNTVGGSAIRSYAADLCTLEVRSCSFVNNRTGSKTQAQSGNASGGGAIYWKSVSGKATLIDCTFTNNHSSVVGGAIYNTGYMDIIGCHFEGNTSLGHGGAIAVETPYTSNDYTSISDVNALVGSLTLDSNTKLINNEAKRSGGGIYFDASARAIGSREIETYKIELTIDGAEIRGNKAGEDGGGVAIYLDYEDFDYKSGVTINDGSIIMENTAGGNGGAIRIKSNATCDCKSTEGVIMYGGTLENNSAANGGAIYIETGNTDAKMNYTIFGGIVKNNTATSNGGAIYVAGGDFAMSGGTLMGNTAEQSGGAVYVNNGNVTMKGGTVSSNKATSGDGGAFYVSSDGATVSVIVQTGEISGNSSAGKGGAIAVVGTESEEVEITVQIGVNEEHFDSDYNPKNCDHNKDTEDIDTCPVVKNNTAGSEGGAIYITGSKTTKLNIYCIDEAGNRGGGNAAGSEETSLSDFLKVEGGNVLISAVQTGTDNVYYGNSVINSSIHVTGGDLTLSGALSNPVINAPITVDVKEGVGSYTDTRKNIENVENIKQYYKVQYFENFVENNIVSGQYTVYQIPQDETHTVWGVIYSHTGYTIVGWNTDKDATTSTHTPGETIKLEDDLILYAIWSSNVYYIVYDANVPAGASVMGTMEKQTLSCATPTALTLNAYVYAGRIFLGWSENQNATTATYTDGENVDPLRDEYGETVTLYAIWKVCGHTGTDSEKYTYSADGDTLTCTCACTYYITATIKGNPGVYAPNTSRPASIVFGASNPTDEGDAKAFTYNNITVGNQTLKEIAEAAIKYAKKDNGDVYSVLSVGVVPENAGTYKASVTVAEQEIYVVYVIDKAQQTPPSKPVFTVSDNSTLIITPVSASEESGVAAQYKIAYGTADGWAETEWFSDFNYSIDTAWTTYYVIAYYPESDNYYASVNISSDAEFITGNVKVSIIVGEGLTYTFTANNSSGTARIIIAAVDENKYYVQNYSVGNEVIFNVISQTGKTSSAKLDKIDTKTFELTNVSNTNDESITITFSGAKLIATVTPSVTPDEEFGEVVNEVVNTETKIAKDSAFTSYFEVNYYEGYSGLALNFNTALPVGTTIIMVDKSGENPTYWYANVTGTEKSSFALSDFAKMGEESTEKFAVSGTTLKYQFIVDFSDVESNSIKSLTANLTATKADDYVPALSSNGISVTLAEVTSALTAGTDNSVAVTYPKSEGVASKWEEREGALVLTPANGVTLPIDVSLEVAETIGGTTKTTVYYRNEDGQFIVPFSSEATSVKFALKSNMFSATEYKFNVAMYASHVDKAPFGGINIQNSTEISLTATVESKPSAKITGTQNLFAEYSGDELKLTVQLKLEGYDYKILLMRKGTDGKYAATGWSYEETGTNTNTNTDTDTGIKTIDVSLTLNQAYDKGSYCVAVVVKNSENTTILSVPYYFIIQ